MSQVAPELRPEVGLATALWLMSGAIPDADWGALGDLVLGAKNGIALNHNDECSDRSSVAPGESGRPS